MPIYFNKETIILSKTYQADFLHPNFSTNRLADSRFLSKTKSFEYKLRIPTFCDLSLLFCTKAKCFISNNVMRFVASSLHVFSNTQTKIGLSRLFRITELRVATWQLDTLLMCLFCRELCVH